MTKTIAFSLVVAASLGLAACSSKTTTSDNAAMAAESATNAATNAANAAGNAMGNMANAASNSMSAAADKEKK